MRRLVVIGAVLACLAGCGDDAGDAAGGDGAWRTSTDPVDVDGLAWASGTTVHLADGTNIDTGEAIATYVVAGDGVYFVEDDDPEDDFAYNDALRGELKYADPDGTVEGTGIEILAHTLTSSPDGRYLAALDMGSGEEDSGGVAQAEAVVWDLAAGTEALRTTDGMGDPTEDDFAWLYPEVTIDIPLLTADEVYVDGIEQVWSYDLATGDGEQLPDDAEVPTYDPDSRVSPDGDWQISGNPDEPIREDEANQSLEPADGQSWTPSLPTTRWQFLGWADDHTAWGVARGDVAMLMSCDVVSRECQVIDESAGQQVQFPVEELSRDGLALDPDLP